MNEGALVLLESDFCCNYQIILLDLALQMLKTRLKARFKKKHGFKAQCIQPMLLAPR